MDENNLGGAESAPLSSTHTESAPSQAPVSSERTFRQSEVNDLVKRVKHEAVENYRRLESTQPQYAEQKYSGNNNQNSQQNQHTSLPESDIRRLAAEEAQRLRDEWVSDAQSRNEQESAQRIVKTFYDKISTGKDKYDDYESVTGDIELSRFPNVVQLLAEHIDNSDDVLYELGKDRMKMAQLEQLSLMSPRDAMVQAKRLAQSIKDNSQARSMRTPNAPLSQQRPSNVGTDGGALTMADLKRKYKG